MKINSKFQIKMLLDKRKVQLKQLAKMLSEKTGKKYTLDGLSHKMRRGTITYDEMLIISELLKYEIKFIDTET